MLKFIGGPDKCYLGAMFCFQDINRNPFLVGRSDMANYVLNSRCISREHCRFKRSDGNVWFVECLSNFGLSVDGKSLAKGEKKRLTGESLIILGEHIYLLFAPKLRKFSTCDRSVEIVGVVDVAPRTVIKNQQTPPPKKELSDSTVSNPEDCTGDQSNGMEEENNNTSLQLLEEAKQQIDDGKRQIKKLTKELAERNEELVRLRADNNTSLQGLDEAKRQIDDGKRQIKKLTKELAERNEELVRLRADNDTSLQRLEEAKQQIDDGKRQIKKLTKELAEHNEELVRLRVDNDTLLQGLDEAKQQIDDGKRQIKKLTKELAEHNEELVRLRAEISELRKAENEVENLQKQVSDLETKLVDANHQHVRIQKEVEMALAKAASAKCREKIISEEGSIVENKLKEAEVKLNEITQRNSMLELEMLTYRTDVAIKEEEYKRFKAKSEAVNQKIEYYKLSLEKREIENINLGLELANAQSLSSNLSADLAKSEKQGVAVSQANAELTKALDTLRGETETRERDFGEELNAAKEKAKAEQVESFEEFIELDLQCAICFELVIASTVLNCGHTFCSKCIREWRERSSDCPTCRTSIHTMQTCKMLDSFIARTANKLSEEFRDRRKEATFYRGTDSQGHSLSKKRKVNGLRGRQINFDLPGPVPEPHIFVDLT